MKTKQNVNLVIGLVVLVVVALLLAWYVKQRPSPASNLSNNTNMNDTTPQPDGEDNPPAVAETNYVIVSDQRAGTTIDIDEVRLDRPGFVAIHEVVGNQPGKIVAQSNLLPVGTRADLVINYKAMAGKTYIAMLHSDNGDSKFNATVDLPILNGSGQPIMATFKVVP
jgi:hypothetical protein